MYARTVISFLLLALVACSGGSNSSSAGPGPGSDTNANVPPGVFASAELQRLAYPVRVAVAADGVVYTTDAKADAVIGLRDGQPVVAITNVPRPLGVAVAGSLLYVGSAGRRTIEVYDLAKQRGVRTIPSVEMPNAIAVAPDGFVYVADSKARVVRVFDSQGAPFQTIGASGQFRFPISVAVDASRVVVGDQGTDLVHVFDRSGNLIRSFGGELTSADSYDAYRGRFTNINSVALAGRDVYVLDSAHSHVQAFDERGTPKGIFGYAGDCSTCVKLALDIAVDAEGRVLATDSERGRVVQLSTEMR